MAEIAPSCQPLEIVHSGLQKPLLPATIVSFVYSKNGSSHGVNKYHSTNL